MAKTRKKPGTRSLTRPNNATWQIPIWVGIIILLLAFVSLGWGIWGSVYISRTRSTQDSTPEEARKLREKYSKVKPEENKEANKLLNLDFQGYRVGDTFTFAVFPFTNVHGMPIGRYSRKFFPGSIAAEYSKRARCVRDAPTMSSVISSLAPYLKLRLKGMLESDRIRIDNVGINLRNDPEYLRLSKLLLTDKPAEVATNPEDTAIVHIRVGDVLTSKFAMTLTGVTADKYSQIVDQLQKMGIKRAILIGGIHQTPEPGFSSPAIEYGKTVAALLADKGISTTFMSSDPDVDLAVLVEARTLVVQPKSAFARIANRVRTHRNLPWQTTIVLDPKK
nr:hypothetical protein [Sicyoidochytrium minutum DNA virus]